MRVLGLTSCRGRGRRTGSEYTDIQSPHRCFCSCRFHRGIKNKLSLLNKQKLCLAAVNDFLVEMIVGSHCSPCVCVDMYYQHNSLVNKIVVFSSFLQKKKMQENQFCCWDTNMQHSQHSKTIWTHVDTKSWSSKATPEDTHALINTHTHTHTHTRRALWPSLCEVISSMLRRSHPRSSA